jgi:HK97 family phage prohead protease
MISSPLSLEITVEILTVGFNPLAEPVTGVDPLLDLGELPENSFRGVASVFGGVVDAFIPTIIHPGAFTKTISEQRRGIKILWQHDTDEPIGLPTKLFESEEGLVLQAQISRTPAGIKALTLLRDGVIDALSIGFDPIKEDVEKDAQGNQIRHIRELRLWEVSVVTFGADADARIREVNSHPAAKTFKTVSTGRITQSLVTDFADLPLSAQTEWDAEAAKERVETWAKDNETPATVYPGLQIADVEDGHLTVVPAALFAASVDTMRGVVPHEDTAPVQRHLTKYFAKAGITPPWDELPATFEGYSKEDALFLLGRAIYSGTINASMVEALQSFVTAEPHDALTGKEDIDSQLLNAELAMAELQMEQL